MVGAELDGWSDGGIGWAGEYVGGDGLGEYEGWKEGSGLYDWVDEDGAAGMSEESCGERKSAADPDGMSALDAMH